MGCELSSLRTAVSHSQRSSSQSMSDVASYSSRSGKGGCSRDEAKRLLGGFGFGGCKTQPFMGVRRGVRVSTDLARGGSVTGGATTGLGFGGCKTRPSMGVRRGVRVSIDLARGGSVTGGATTGFGFRGCKPRPFMGVRRGVRVGIDLAGGGSVTGGATTGFGFTGV